MGPYAVLFFLPTMLAWSNTKAQLAYNPKQRWPSLWRGMFALLVLMVGLRYEVGGDWLTYSKQLLAVKDLSFSDALTISDPAYASLNWLGVQLGGGVYFVNTMCAIIFAWGLIIFCRSLPLPWLAMVVAVPYLVIVVAMGYTRQGVAIGLAMVGLVALGRGRLFTFIGWIAIAATFHKSAVILVPLAIFQKTKRRWLAWVLVLGSSAVLYNLLLQSSVNTLESGYLQAEYESSGAAIRVAMNALPALIFLIFRQRFYLHPAQKKFWTWMSLGALGFIVLLALSPSSTAVDRVALYWIPLQLFVWSHLPVAMGSNGRVNARWMYYITGYSFAIQFVWLVFAKTAFAWLPYQFYPWVLLFGQN